MRARAYAYALACAHVYALALGYVCVCIPQRLAVLPRVVDTCTWPAQHQAQRRALRRSGKKPLPTVSSHMHARTPARLYAPMHMCMAECGHTHGCGCFFFVSQLSPDPEFTPENTQSHKVPACMTLLHGSARGQLCRAEPHHAEPSRAEPCGAERVEPSLAEPSHAVPGHAVPSHAVPWHAVWSHLCRHHSSAGAGVLE